MPITDTFRKWRRKASAAAPLFVELGGRQPRMTPRRYDALADEGYRKNIIAYRAIKLVSMSAATVPLMLTDGRTRLEEHPLRALLSSPNPQQGSAEFFESVYAYYLIAGNSYVEAAGADGNVRELWSLRPDRMRIIPGYGGLPEAYRYQLGGQTVDYPADPLTGASRILHVKSFHPLDDHYGMSPLEAAAYAIDQHNEAAKWNASLLQSSGRPSGALVFRPAQADAPDTLTEEQRRALKNEIETYYSGGMNAGRPLVLEGGLDWKEMSLSPRDMDWLAGKDVSAREIALAFHVPPQLIGIPGSLTFANFEQARLALYDDAVLPLVTHLCDELNRWLCPQFGAGLSLQPDIDRIEALAPRREKVWERVNSATFMTTNEKRRALGLNDIAGGDVLAGEDKA